MEFLIMFHQLLRFKNEENSIFTQMQDNRDNKNLIHNNNTFHQSLIIGKIYKKCPH